MEAENNLLLLLQNPDLPADLKHIAQKVLDGERITFDEVLRDLRVRHGKAKRVGAHATPSPKKPGKTSLRS